MLALADFQLGDALHCDRQPAGQRAQGCAPQSLCFLATQTPCGATRRAPHPLAAPRAGYEGFLTQTNAPARRGPVKPEERLFSSSSVTGASHLPA